MSLRLHPEYGVNASVQKCFFCGEAVGVALLGWNRGKEAPREVVLNYNPCDECEKKFATGVTFFEMSDEKTPTSNYVVVNDAAVADIIVGDELRASVLKERKALLLRADFQKLFGHLISDSPRDDEGNPAPLN